MNERLKELAEQAGLEELGDSDWCSLNHPDVRAEHLERFADLVRQDEREACARKLRELKPVAWAAPSIYGGFEGLSFDKSSRFDTPLYALNEETK